MDDLKPSGILGDDFVDSEDYKLDGVIQKHDMGSSKLFESSKIGSDSIVENDGGLFCCSKSKNGKDVEQTLQNVGSTSDENCQRESLTLKVDNDRESLLNINASVFVETTCEVVQDDDILECEEEHGGVIGEKKQVWNNQDHNFCEGDIIWVKTKAESWWPGKIFNPKEVPHFSVRRPHKDCLLAGYFGNSSFAWCRPTQMKPFSNDLDEISKGGKSRNFQSAVQKAMGEIGKGVKWEMIGSCRLKDDLSEKLQFIPFDTARFLAQLKSISCQIFVLSDFEITVLKSHLSAFYSCLGHCKTPLQQKPDAEIIEKLYDRKALENGKGFELRERKKIKYLSPPFVHHNSRHNNLSVLSGSEMLEVNRDLLQPNSSFICKGKKKSLELPEKFNSKADNVSFSEMLWKLRFAATYEGENPQFDLIEEFFSKFRSSVFHGAEVLAPSPVETYLPDKKYVVLEKRKRNIKASLVNSNTIATIERTGEDGSIGTMEISPLSNLKSDQKMVSQKKKAENQTDFSKIRLCAFGMNPEEVKINEVQECTWSGIPDLNANVDDSGLLVEEDAPLIHMDIVKRLLKKKKALENIPSIADVFQGNKGLNNNFQGQDSTISLCPSPTKSSTDLSVVIMAESTLPDENTKPNSLENGPKLEKKKIKQEMTVPGVPDSNENSDAIESKHKKRRKDSEIPDLLTNVTELLGINEGESISGTALLLAFAPNFDFPSKEALITTFCSYGTLIESETRLIKDSNVGQVIFLNSCDAGVAFRSLLKNKPFGEGLVNYRLHNHSGASRVIKTEQIVPSTKPKEGGIMVSPAKPSSLIPQFSYLHIRKNLEMMNSVLEKSGTSLCPEIRTRLESEIRNLMKKVNTIPSSSSTT